MRPKKFLALFLVLILLAPSSYAAVHGASMGMAGIAPGPKTQIGVAAAVQGRVEVVRGSNAVGQVIESGQQVFLGDVINTHEEGGLQLMMMDQTVFTIGPKSSMEIEKFNYEEKTSDGEIAARVHEGTFRMITGKIGQKKPGSMQVNLPTGVMAVRGTMAFIVIENGKATGILGGPGANHNTDHRPGAIEMKNDVGDKTDSTLVIKPGSASTIDGPGASPSPAFDYPPELYSKLENTFSNDSKTKKKSRSKSKSGSGSQSSSSDDSEGDGSEDAAGDGDDDGGVGDDDGGSVTEQAGQDEAGSLDFLDDGGDFGDDGDFLEDLLGEEGSDQGDASGAILDGVSTINDLATVESGIFHYADTSVTLFVSGTGSPSGTYDFFLDIDFGAGTIGGGNSKVEGTDPIIDSGDSFEFKFDTPVDYLALDGDAAFTFSAINDTGGSIMTATADVDVLFYNEDGEPGAFVEHFVAIQESGPDAVEGDGIADPFPGLST